MYRFCDYNRVSRQRVATCFGFRADAWRLPMAMRHIISVLSLVMLTCCFANLGQAQERNYAPRGHAAGSLFSKVDHLQQSVKRKLKSALGVKDSSQNTQGDQPDHDQIHHDQTTQAASQSLLTPNQSNPVVGSPGSMAPASHRRGFQNPGRQDDGRVIAATENGWNQPERYPSQTLPPNNMRPVEYRDYEEPQGYIRVAEDSRHNSQPLPPPADDSWPAENSVLQPPASSGSPVRRWESDSRSYPPQGYANQRPIGPGETPNYGSFSGAVAGSSSPLPRGTVLGDSQITATQHALRLIEENGDLKAKLAMMDAEIKRLKDKLTQSETLLGRSTEAVEAAHQEIQTLSATNKQLQTSLSDSQQQYNRYLLETDRMLQSIREELDDVLVREISAKGN
ncbi:MAG: hypothetical protein KDB00_25675 [Planctomycetales bacterium]|nr:hypothetical protein [Planctomycetales bacterium]